MWLESLLGLDGISELKTLTEFTNGSVGILLGRIPVLELD